jgi:hypothetical protein
MPWEPVLPVLPVVPWVPWSDKFDLLYIFPLPSNTRISFTVDDGGVEDKFNVFRVASDPLTITFFQFGISIFFYYGWLLK